MAQITCQNLAIGYDGRSILRNINFSVNEGEVAIEISNYDNILGELLLYEQPLEYKRCAVCGTVIKKTRSPKKYCTNCAYKENIRKTKENKRSLKTQSS